MQPFNFATSLQVWECDRIFDLGFGQIFCHLPKPSDLHLLTRNIIHIRQYNIYCQYLEVIYLVTSLKVWEGDKIFDQSKAEVKYTITFPNLKAGGKNI